MRRVNSFDVRPRSQRETRLLFELLDAAAALYNEVTYARRQALFDGKSVWSVDADHYRCRYKGVLGSATAQQVIRKSADAWKSYFALLQADEEPSPPGYWKDGDRRELRLLARCDQYTLEWGEWSRLEIPVGHDLKEAYGLGYHERLRLEARGDPRWMGANGRLEVVYEKDAEAFRARHPVSDAVLRRDHSLATSASDDAGVAALDIGANNLVAVTTSHGHQRLYRGRRPFQRFRCSTETIGAAQRTLARGTYSSTYIRRLYGRQTARRDHLQDALIRDLAEWLHTRGVGEVIVGDLDDVLETHWSATVNEKTHQFWSHGRFRRRLQEVLEGEYGIAVREESEADSSSTCPECGGEAVDRKRDLFRCLA